MQIETFLKEKKPSLLREWKLLLLEAYPEDSRNFFQKEKDHFANPVGSILFSELDRLLDMVIDRKEGEELEDCLDKIIRIRAVQDLRPSEAIGFIFGLKGLVRKALEGFPGKRGSYANEMEEAIDRVGLRALDIYWRMKRQLQDLRVLELKRQYERLLVRAKVMAEIPD